MNPSNNPASAGGGGRTPNLYELLNSAGAAASSSSSISIAMTSPTQHHALQDASEREGIFRAHTPPSGSLTGGGGGILATTAAAAQTTPSSSSAPNNIMSGSHHPAAGVNWTTPDQTRNAGSSRPTAAGAGGLNGRIDFGRSNETMIASMMAQHQSQSQQHPLTLGFPPFAASQGTPSGRTAASSSSSFNFSQQQGSPSSSGSRGGGGRIIVGDEWVMRDRRVAEDDAASLNEMQGGGGSGGARASTSTSTSLRAGVGVAVGGDRGDGDVTHAAPAFTRKISSKGKDRLVEAMDGDDDVEMMDPPGGISGRPTRAASLQSCDKQQSQPPTVTPSGSEEEGMNLFPSSASASSLASAASSETATRAALRKGLMSPPTPAPSPTPGRNGWWGTIGRGGNEHQQQSQQQQQTSGEASARLQEAMDDGMGASQDAASAAAGVAGYESSEALASGFDPQSLILAFPSLPPPTRLALLSTLLPLLTTPELLMLSQHIGPRLKRDFLRDLPTELALHILSFVDDPKTLARAACVSRHWRKLLEDEQTWKEMCDRHQFQTSHVLPSVPKLPRARNAPDVALVSRPSTTDDGNAEAGPSTVIPSSTNDVTPAFGVTNPTMYHSSIVSRDHGVMEDTNSDAFVQAAPEAFPLDVEDNSMRVEADDSTEAAPPPPPPAALPTSESPFTSTSGTTMNGRINGQLPPLPSVIAPSAGPLSPTNRRTYSASQFRADSQRPASAGPLDQPAKSALGPSTGYGVPSKKIKEPGFSYKQHFKRAYLTESNWLRGGRLMSSHTSNDDGVVTSLAVDQDHIIIGMANSKIHVFDAATGAFKRTLNGHTLGVWCLALVSAGGGDSATIEDLLSDDEEEGGRASSSSPMRSTSGPSFSIGSFERAKGRKSGLGKGRKRTRNGAMRSSSADDTRRGGSPFDQSGRRHASQPLADDSAQARKMPQSDICGAAKGWGQKTPLVVSGGCDRDVRVWNLETGECIYTLAGHTSTIRCIKVLDGRPIAVSGSRDGTVKVWDIENGRIMHSLVGHQHSVRCIEVAGNHVASGSYDCTCRIWNVETGQCLQVLRGHYHQIYAVAFDGERVATGSLDSTVRIWSAATGECLALLQGHTSLVGQLQFTGDTLVTGGSDGRVIIFEMTKYTCLQRICAHDNSVTCLQFDDRFIVSGGNDGRVKLWDIKTGNYIRELSKPCEAVWRIAFRDDKCSILCKRQGKTVLEVLSFIPDVE